MDGYSQATTVTEICQNRSSIGRSVLPPNGYSLHIQLKFILHIWEQSYLVKKWTNTQERAVLPVAFGQTLLTVTTGVDFVVEDLSVCQISPLPGQDGLDVIVVQTQRLQRRH